MYYLDTHTRLQIGTLVAHRGFAGFLLDGFVEELREARLMEADSLRLTSAGVAVALSGEKNDVCIHHVKRYIDMGVLHHYSKQNLPKEHD